MEKDKKILSRDNERFKDENQRLKAARLEQDEVIKKLGKDLQESLAKGKRGPKAKQRCHLQTAPSSRKGSKKSGEQADHVPEGLQDLDQDLVRLIIKEIVSSGDKVTFIDIAGLEYAKEAVRELIVYPTLRPDIFTGLRACPKALLLFGPPGTGECGLDNICYYHRLR